jgi:hypothetical protein
MKIARAAHDATENVGRAGANLVLANRLGSGHWNLRGQRIRIS